MSINTIHEKYRSERSREVVLVCHITDHSISAVYYDLVLERRIGRSICFGADIAFDTLMYQLRMLISSSIGEYSILPEDIKKAAFAAPEAFSTLMMLQYDTPEDYLLHPDTELMVLNRLGTGGFAASLASVELAEGTAVVEIADSINMAWLTDGKVRYASYPLTGALTGYKLDCGMPVEKGAIDDVWRDSSRILCYSVEGDGDSRGIAPSGAVAALRVMLEEGIVDSDGIMTDRDILYIGEDFYISQADVRAMQSDRAMISAALSQLPKESNVYFTGEVFASNGMKNLCGIGAIPQSVAHKAGFCRNAAEQGMINLLTDSALCSSIDDIIDNCVDVSDECIEQIDELYIEKLVF